MQSINAGFQSLKALLPHADGEKLSKAAILQQTAEYIFALEEDKTRLMQQNSHLKRQVQEYTGSSPKRKRGDESDEGIGSPDSADEGPAELRQRLEKERNTTASLQEKVRSLELQLQPVIPTAPSPQTATLIPQPTPQQPEVSEDQELLLQPQHQPSEMLTLPSLTVQLLVADCPPAPTHHPTVIVPAPSPAPLATMVTATPSSVISSVSTSKQNLDTIVQAIQHIEATQQGIEETVVVETEVVETEALVLAGEQYGVKRAGDWQGLLASSQLLIRGPFGHPEPEVPNPARRELLAALQRPRGEQIPSVLIARSGVH
ncbi:transcription factor AP-4 isoform X2 [Callorhinchus milii]|nr:transcription factor AP-4 isoform X2 [Callorhinchus milii]